MEPVLTGPLETVTGERPVNLLRSVSRHRTLRYVLRRLLIAVGQLLAIIVFTFFILRLLPGDPVLLRVGPYATTEVRAAAKHAMGLDKPLPVQFLIYMTDVAHGDLGTSFFTRNPVTFDLRQRFGTTMVLIGLSMTIATAIAIPIAVYQAQHPGSWIERITRIYVLLAGALPEFYIGLLLIFVFFYKLRIAPPPLGRIDPLVATPPTITGSYLIDAILTGNLEAAGSAASYLILPVTTFVLITCGAVMRMMRASMTHLLNSDFIHYARLIGLSPGKVRSYALRNAIPPVITLVGIYTGVMIGGAVLIETVFSLGGLGQYAVQSAALTDYNALTGFVILASIVTLTVLLIVDLVQAAIDPRIRY